MAVSANWFGPGLEELLKGTLDLDGDTFKCALVDSGYTPDRDLHDQWTDISGDEASGTGYTAGGATLGSLAVAKDTANDQIEWDAADVTWSSSTITARYAVVYDDTHANDVPLILVDFGEDKSSSSGDFTIQWDAEGMGKASY